MIAREHAERADQATAYAEQSIDRGKPREAEMWVGLAQAHALTALALCALPARALSPEALRTMAPPGMFESTVADADDDAGGGAR